MNKAQELRTKAFKIRQEKQDIQMQSIMDDLEEAAADGEFECTVAIDGDLCDDDNIAWLEGQGFTVKLASEQTPTKSAALKISW